MIKRSGSLLGGEGRKHQLPLPLPLGEGASVLQDSDRKRSGVWPELD